jgi:hypothetical protein
MGTEGIAASVIDNHCAANRTHSAVFSNYRSPLFVFCIAFGYTLVAALMIQTVILPNLPQLHAGHGLMVGHDSVGFHALADQIATRIQTSGWQEWQFAPDHLQRVVGIIAAVYAITGVHEPFVLIPIYSLLYATSVTCIYCIVRSLSENEGGARLAAAAFLLFPSAAIIYADPHKDAWSCAGVLLLIAAWVEMEARKRSSFFELTLFILTCCIAIALTWVVRPYLIKLFLGGLLTGLTVLALANAICSRDWRGSTKRYTGYFIVLAIMATVSFSSSAPLLGTPVRPPTFMMTRQTLENGTLQTSSASANSFFLRIIGPLLSVREGFVTTPGGSVIDKGVRFSSFFDTALYVPRALQIGLLAPFPNMWFEHGMTRGSRFMRIISGAEMLISYFLLLGFTAFLPSIPRQKIALCCFVAMTCLALIGVMSFTMPNIGTLYRMRYPLFMLIVGIGASGWPILLMRIRSRRLQKSPL